jgi:hypothetical protein
MGFFTHINCNDSPSLSDILNMADKEEQASWFDAMDDEVNALLSKHTFRKVLRAVALTKGSELLAQLGYLSANANQMEPSQN